MSVEATKQRIEIIREQMRAAQRIADMRLALHLLDKADQNARIERLMALSDAEQQTLNRSLRELMPILYKKLLHAPASETLREVNPLNSPNGVTYWRDLDIAGIGRIDVHYVQNEGEASPSYYALQVGALPIVDSRPRAGHDILTEFRPDQPLPHCMSTVAENSALLVQRSMLISICEAAGIE